MFHVGMDVGLEFWVPWLDVGSDYEDSLGMVGCGDCASRQISVEVFGGG